jgi:S1-C subfamily serine protease
MRPAVLPAGVAATVSPMPWDDDDADDADVPRPPLPPDDRLWRHPSEMAQLGTGGTASFVEASRPSGGRSSGWSVVIAAGLTGAMLAASAMVISGHLGRRIVEKPVVEKVAVTPIVSAPMLRGDTGVTAIVRRLKPAIVRLDLTTARGSSTGSGVVFRDDGMILTSAHLVSDASKVAVRLSDGRRLDGEIVGLDPTTDVAVVDVDATGLPVAVLGSVERLEVGAAALAVGCQPGDGAASPSVTTGVFSDLSHSLDTGKGWLHGLLQTDAPVDSTTSGGALVDDGGAVVGIVTSWSDSSSDDAGRLGFATPIDLAHRVALQLIDRGQAMHPWIGVQGTDLPGDESQVLGVHGGAKVQGVEQGSPAAKAGLDSDDVITEVDGQEVESMPGLAVEVRRHDPGDQVTVGYWRDGGHHEARVTVGERP